MPEKLTTAARLTALALLASACGYTQATCNQCAATYIPASEIDAYLANRHTQRAQLRQELEARHQPQGIRQRLLARRRNP